MWHPITVRHDKSFLRITERPLVEHLADKLNDFEKENGEIKATHVIQHEEDKFIELIVRTER